MGTTNGTPSLADTLAGAEANLLVGREGPLARFRALLAEGERRPVCIWVSGSAGSGKSAFIRTCAHLAHTLGWGRLSVEGAHLPRGGPDTAAAMTTLLGTAERLLLAIDDYDRMGSLDPWFRREVLPRVTAGRCVLMASREPLAQAWAVEAAWRSLIEEIRLAPLSAGDAVTLLARLDVAMPSARQELAALSAGSPRLLHLAAAAWIRTCGSHEAKLPSLAAAALEQFLHPGSRRLAWRPGVGDLDQLVAMAASVRTFDRPLLRTLAGAAEAHGVWEEFLDLPVVEAVDGRRHRLHGLVRPKLSAAVRQHLPWRERNWRQRAVAEYRARLRAEAIGPGQAWLEIAAVAREAPWFPALHPEAEAAWEIRGEAALPAAASAWGPGAHELRSAARCGVGFLAIRERTGGLLAMGALLPPTTQGLPPDGDPVLAHTLVSAGPSGPAQCVLLRELLGQVRVPLVALRASPPGAADGAIDLLGFRRIGVTCAGVALYLANLGGMAGGSWPPLGGNDAGLPGVSPGEAARQALAALHDPPALARTALGKWLAARCAGTGATPSGWIEDALHAADMRVGAVDGGALLRSYHLEGVRPHEVLAERLGLPRTTYFRVHRQALVILGEALLGSSGNCPHLQAGSSASTRYRAAVGTVPKDAFASSQLEIWRQVP